MPKKGFTAITIKISVHKKLVELAKKLGKSVPEIVLLSAEKLYQSELGDEKHE